MELLADEDVPRPVIKILRQKFDVRSVDEELKGAKDSEVLDYAEEHGLVLLTFDTDFTDKRGNHKGIIVITSRDRYSNVAQAVEQLLNITEPEDLDGELFMISP